MKATKYIFPAAFLAVFSFSMCDYVTDPKDIEDIVVTFDSTKRVAIIEEWTGHTCIACPAAARDIEQLDSVYGESFIAISIHDDYFAEPCPVPHPTPPCGTGSPGAFGEDFRCPTGASYSAAHTIGPQSPPQGMVNRLGMPNNEVKNRGTWPGLVDSIVQTNAIASIHIDHTYNSSTRAITATVRGTWLMTYTGNMNVAIMLTESGMIGWQTDGPTACDSVFEFNHVLRECINTPGSITGSPLFAGTTGIGTTYSYSLPSAYTLPANFNAANCHLIAIIYDTVTGEVMQAWEEDVE